MVVSLSKKFIFVANLKCASTAIEAALRPLCEFAILQSQFGKHQSLSLFQQRFSWLLKIIDLEEFFVFGVMRDPIDFMISLYNSHMHPKFSRNPKLYTAGMSFDDFIDVWGARHRGQVEQQHVRFLSAGGRIAANYIISYDRLSEGLDVVADRIGAPRLRTLDKINMSYGAFRRNSLAASQEIRIEQSFATDRLFMREFCNRLLNVEDRKHSFAQPEPELLKATPRRVTEIDRERS